MGTAATFEIGRSLTKIVAENVNEKFGDGTINVDSIDNITFSQFLEASLKIDKVRWENSNGIIDFIKKSFKETFGKITFVIDALFGFKFNDSAEKGEAIIGDSQKYVLEKTGKDAASIVNESMRGEMDLGGAISGGIGQITEKLSKAFSEYDWYEGFGGDKTTSEFSDALESFIFNAVKGVEGYAGEQTEKIGKEVDAGTAKGVDDNLEIATGAVGTVADKMLEAAKKKLDINSPSKKFEQIGSYIVLGMKGGISDKWGEFSTFWTSKHNSVIDTFKGIKTSFNEKGMDTVSGLESGIGSKWVSFITDWGEKKNDVVGKYDNIESNMDIKGKSAVSGLEGGIKSVWGNFNEYWTGRKDSVVDKFKNINSDFQGKGKDIVSGLETGISNNWSGFVGWWEDKIKAMVNGILHGINWVLEKIGSDTRLKDWEGFATGSNGLPQNTIGIVNDQKGSTYKELIVPPHGKPFIPEGRNVMLPMKKGTKIMPARQTKDFMEKMNGMPHFAGGIGDFFKGAWAKISEFTGNIWDYISNPGKILQIAFDKFTDLSGMLEPVLSIATGAAKTLLDGATGFIKKMFDENLTVQYNPSKGVEQWRGLATKALQITNQFTEPNLTALLAQMQHESSGNPKAINLWDSNAKKGTPSKGLMQVIDPTFRAYALSPHNKDIWDPLSNMIAAIRYTVSHYGSLYSGWTARGYKGYASGIGKINLADLIPKYRAGGFPEDGLFYANHTELVGRFSNGQTAVANNQQITQGIAEAIYPAVYNAVSSAMRNNGTSGSGDISLQLNLDGDAVYKNVVKRTREGRNRNIGGRLVLAEEVY